MITYNSTTGEWGGGVMGKSYSGHGEGLNNPVLEAVADVGPIPRGRWRVVHWFTGQYENKGKYVAQLLPVNHNAHGRSGFLFHGDNAAGDHSASHGCVISGPDLRINQLYVHLPVGAEFEVI